MTLAGTPAARPSPSVGPTVPAEAIRGFDTDEADALQSSALDFGRTQPVHEGQAFRVAEIALREASQHGYPDDLAYVLIEFDEPIAFDRWPAEAVCAVGRRSDDITGIAWLLAPDTGEVEAYSPQWDYRIDCV